jgi:MurNAc alpha-1-phosphate uridylyltransferase
MTPPPAAAPQAAMILAAGLGTRMRPLTETTPKPMVRLAGRPMIDHLLDRLADAGVRRVVVNLHHCGEALEHHLADRRDPAIAFSPEPSLRGTAGGVRAALPLLGGRPFFVINGDVVWLDGPVPVLHRLAARWSEDRHDALAVVVATVQALGIGDIGDFDMDPLGRVTWPAEGLIAPFSYAGIQLVHPRLFDDLPPDPVQMPLAWSRAMAAGRFEALRFDGNWAHVGTPRALRHATRMLEGDDLRALTHGV